MCLASTVAYPAPLTGEFPDLATITLPRGQRPAFVLDSPVPAGASVVKGAGDDPDVTHGALIGLSHGVADSGVPDRLSVAARRGIYPGCARRSVAGAWFAAEER